MTAHQQTKLNQLARDYQSTGFRKSGDGSDSVLVNCYDVSLPERCVVCGQEVHSPGARTPVWDTFGDHMFRKAVPVATFRVAPSGATFDITGEDTYMPVPS